MSFLAEHALPLLYVKALSAEILTSLRPVMNLLLGYSSGRPVQHQLAWGFVLQPNSFFKNRIWPAWVDNGCVLEGEEMRPIINLRRQTSSSFMILTFPLGPCGPLAPLAPLGDREKARTGNTSRERLPPRPSPPEPQLMPGAMSDGDDHQPPQDDRQRERSRSRDRVHPHAQVPQDPQIQPVVTPEPADKQMRTLQMWIPHHISWTTTISWTERSLQKRRKIQIAWAGTSTFIFAYQPAATTCCTSFGSSVNPDSGNWGLRWSFSNRGSTKSRERPFKVITRPRKLTETGSKNLKREENYCRTAAEWIAESP